MLEVHRADVEGQLAVTDLPALRQGGLVPAAAAGLTALIAAVAYVPVRIAARRFPDGLRVGAHEIVFAPALQLFPARTVDQFKILPFVRNVHRRSSVHKAYYSRIIHDILPLKPFMVKGAARRNRRYSARGKREIRPLNEAHGKRHSRTRVRECLLSFIYSL